MTTPNFDRTHAVEEAKKKSARADMKQHADKLIQGFEKLNDTHAKRAIWELVQNACDMSDHCEITIDFRNNGFSFSHNGKPFTSETLISLIKQVSSKDPDKKDEVGQFGTGFITTHSFGKTIDLNSILKEDEFLINISEFKIDRQAKNSDELVEKLVQQESNVYLLIEEGTVLDSPEIKTTFTYLSDHPQDKENIKQAEENLHHYIPIVLALNNSLKLVTVISSDNSISIYKKSAEEPIESISKIPILKNETPINIFCMCSEDKNIQVVLPLSEFSHTKSIDDSIAKLFLFFPFIGTEKWGCNFVIHSKLFAPTEQRDGIHIKSKNAQIQEKESENRDIIEKASEMIFQFIENNASSLSDPINLTHINFDTKTNTELTNSYFKELKQKWVDKFKTIKLVETEEGREKPSDMLFISSSLLLDSNYYDSIYFILSMFWKNRIPKKEVAQKWTDIVNNWEDESIHFLTTNMLVEKIQEQGHLATFDEKILHSVYEYLLKHNDIKLFEDYKLLPNIKNELIKKGELKRPVNINPHYIDVSDIIIPEIPRKFINSDFNLGLEYNNYNRKNLSDDLNTKILFVTKDLSADKENSIDVKFRDGLIGLCSVFSSESTQSTRRQIIPKICSFYAMEYKEQIIANVEEEKFDYDYTPFRGLIKIFLLDILKKSKIEADWVEKELNFLKECLGIITPYKDLKDIIESIPVFPNQHYKLCNQVSLRIERGFPSKPNDNQFLKDVYQEIITDIRKDLVLNDFADFLYHTNEQTGLELSGKLEQVFKTNGPYEDITNHPNKGIILQIVQKITSNKEWSTFFPTLEDKKAIIMMAKISDPTVKDDLFSIIGLDDKRKISLLGDLSKNPELERIIQLGVLAVEEENQVNADFEFKKEIGVHIEDLIRRKIQKDVEGFSIKINEEQGGQDIIVRLNYEEVYYIEVKSRWDNRSSIIMSNLQLKKSVRKKERYSLCCVEMSDYNPTTGYRYEVKDIEAITDRIKFINDIGYKIEPLISNAVSAEINEDEVKLTDEYRGVVPQAVVNTGMSLDDFVDHLIVFLELKKQ